MTQFASRLQALPGYSLAQLPGIKRRLIERGGKARIRAAQSDSVAISA